MNSFSLLLAATALSGRAGPNVRVIGQEPAPGTPNGGDGDDSDTRADPGTRINPDPLSEITTPERASVRKLRDERERLCEAMAALGFEDDGFYRSNTILPRHRHRKAERAAPSPGPCVMPPKKEHPLSGVRTEAAPKGAGKRTRAERRADNARKLAADKRSGKQPPARPAQASEADEGPEPYRLRGDDEGSWMIDGDPLLRVWDTAADAIAEVPGDWWEEESGCWMATAIEPSADNARKLAVTPSRKVK